MLTIEHLTYLAQLAKLNTSSETLKKFNDEYKDILHDIEKLVQVETTNIPALYNPSTIMQDNKRKSIYFLKFLCYNTFASNYLLSAYIL